MQEILTASWVETYTRWGQPDGEHTYSSQHCIRTTPPAEATYIDFGDSWTHDIWDQRGQLKTSSTWKTCRLDPQRGPYDIETLRRRVLFTPPEENKASKCPGRKWRQELIEHEGHTLLQWSREYVEGNFNIAETVWTQLESGRIARKECRQTDPRTGRLVAVEVWDRYVYNEEPPAGIFEVRPDKPIVTWDGTDSPLDVWDSLPARDREIIQTAINRSDEAWRNADFATFASVWEFGFDSLVPPEAEWQRRVHEQQDRWTQWVSVVETARPPTLVFVSVARHTYSWAPEKRKALRIQVKLRAVGDLGTAEWTGRAEFYLRRKGRGYRIVYWECPWEEIRQLETR